MGQGPQLNEFLLREVEVRQVVAKTQNEGKNDLIVKKFTNSLGSVFALKISEKVGVGTVKIFFAGSDGVVERDCGNAFAVESLQASKRPATTGRCFGGSLPSGLH